MNDSLSTTIIAEPINILCSPTPSSNLSAEKPYAVTTLILLFIMQFGIAAGNIVFFTLALSYLDDNVLPHNSPALIAAALAARIWGWQWGLALNYGVAETTLGWWLGWSIISPTLFVLAFCISLFPKRLLTTVVRQAADNILEVATNNSQLSLAPNKLLADVSFFSSMKRMVTNKILIFNVMATVFIETAIVNYFFQEKHYLQSRFLLPAELSMSISDEWMSRTITSLLKPPIVALTILAGGLIIAKAKPSPRKIAAWNVITASMVCILFVSYIFMDCNHNSIAGAIRGRLMQPFCSKQCICDQSVQFTPICPVDSVQTYYSPCHAGCVSETFLNGQRIFSNCTCGIDTMLALNVESMVHATQGACGFRECQQLWIIFQALTIFGASLLGSGLIGNLLITIRCVLPQDKSLALSIELFLCGLVVYVPGKIGYQVIADETCQYWSADQQKCYLHESPTFGNILNIVTASLVGVSIFFDILVFFFVRDLELYGEEVEDNDYRLIPMQTYISNQNERNL
ncbi:Solute carrier organic anion transporter family member 74D [Pseudolycoriella hygida]|uniref:Solute carrier organic anion transporter family member 74D n=1 Tax=Pseudolycoriella hygida TaxID=35572 RepID=A0A9Q0NEE7_9DIPT|nr:Solute carrier organic anion transporter family member 74D [Pseudolycoriella hygida]